MKYWIRTGFERAAVVLALGSALLISGCGEFFTPVNNSPGGGGTTSFVYVSNIDSSGTGGTVTAYSMTAGVLTALSGSPYTLSATPTSLVVSPNNAFLYVGTNLGVFLYTIGSDGTLTEGNDDTIVYQGPSQASSMVVDSTSSWLLIANQNSTELDALQIDPTTGVPPSVTPIAFTLSSNTPTQLAISPANDNVFVALGTGGTEAVGFSATSGKAWGTAVSISLLAKGGSDTAVAVDPTSTYLYSAETTTNKLRVFTIANLKTEVDYPIGNGPSAILADPTSAFVYVADNTDNNIVGFSQSAGVLTALTGSPYDSAKAPVGLVEDSSKTYVLNIGFGTNPNFYIYNYDATALGTLDVKSTTSTATTSPSLSNAIAVTH